MRMGQWIMLPIFQQVHDKIHNITQYEIFGIRKKSSLRKLIRSGFSVARHNSCLYDYHYNNNYK